jgi:hypothetical protein
LDRHVDEQGVELKQLPFGQATSVLASRAPESGQTADGPEAARRQRAHLQPFGGTTTLAESCRLFA